MGIVYFIGNGFDLNTGLKTAFSDVLESYKNSGSVCLSSFMHDIKTND